MVDVRPLQATQTRALLHTQRAHSLHWQTNSQTISQISRSILQISFVNTARVGQRFTCTTTLHVEIIHDEDACVRDTKTVLNQCLHNERYATACMW